MGKKIATPVSIQSAGDLLQEICTPSMLPDESADSFDYLRQVLFHDLRPQTHLEQLRAEQLVELEWDRLRYRRWRDNLLMAGVRKGADTALMMARREGDQFNYAMYKKFAADLVSVDPERRQAARAVFEERKVNLQELLAVSYANNAKEIATFERQLAEIETRRRKLLDDYERLRASRVRQVEDAQEIEDVEP